MWIIFPAYKGAFPVALGVLLLVHDFHVNTFRSFARMKLRCVKIVGARKRHDVQAKKGGKIG